ncbi:MAG: Atg14 domain-containing protein [archaeon]|nr:Atg14 domain-containing protein [archaeon]
MKIKSVSVLALILLVLFSAIAVADEDTNDSDSDNSSGRRVQADDPRPVAIGVERNPSDAREKVQERLDDLREKYEERKNKIEELRIKQEDARERVKQKLEDFNSLRGELKSSREAAKASLRERLRHKSSEVLIDQVEVILNKLYAMQENENAPDNLSEVITFFEEKQELLQNEAITQGELIVLSKDIQGYWNKWEHNLRISAGKKINNGINGIINKAETFSERLQAVVDTLAENGRDVNAIQNAINQLKEDVVQFQQDYNVLRQAFNDAETKENKAEILNDAYDKLREMNRNLIENLRLIKVMFKATKEIEHNVEITTETSDELNELSDDSTDSFDDSGDDSGADDSGNDELEHNSEDVNGVDVQ